MRKISRIEPIFSILKPKKRVAAYCRVSMETDSMHRSLSAQISYYSDLIQKNPEWEYAGVYADYGISGTGISKRNEFQRLTDDCEKGKVQIILVKSISRFARNTVDLLETVRHLKDLGIEVRFEKENINSMSSDGELMLTILASFAQEESRSISENVKWAIRKGFKNGKPRNSLLYGYRVTDGQLVIEEKEAEIVRRIFEWYLCGDSCYMIAKKLNEAGVKSYYGKKFSAGVIGAVLRQEKYTGNSMLQKHFIEDCITHKEKPNDGELPMYYAEDTHPAIIEQEVYDKVQWEIADRYSVEIKNGTAEKAKFMYHRGDYEKPENPFRKARWSEEQRKVHSEIYKSRETMKFLHYDLSLFIKCGVCGQNLTGQIRKFADNSKELRWVCYKHNKAYHSEDEPGLIPMRDETLKRMIAGVLGMNEFDSKQMCEMMSHISVCGDMLTFHFHDRHEEIRKYVPDKRGYRRRSNNDEEKGNGNSCS